MTKNTDLKTASVLAFERKLDPSDALLFAGYWGERDQANSWPGIAIREKSVRGTISNRLKAKDQDPAKLDAAIENPNLQTVDVATLPSLADTLMVRFTLKVLRGAGAPSACNNAAYQARLSEVVASYAGQTGFGELARRYAHNIANGRFLWRNRMGAEAVEVRVRRMEQGQAADQWTFDGLGLSLRNFEAAGVAQADIQSMAHWIEKGLAGTSFVLLEVTAFARVGAGQEVFPSQELILERGRNDKSKTLYQVSEIAGIHSQKIGNALRSIDTWYPSEGAEALGPIAVEPYGSVTTQGKAYRKPRDKADFYSLLDNWLLKDQKPDASNQHYVMANLIRGGVFGEKAE